MKIKVFNIRLDKEHFEKDQEVINSFLETVRFKKSSTQLIENKVNFWSIVIHYEQMGKNHIETMDKNELNENSLTDDEKEIVANFKQWRLDTSKSKGVPAFMILTNKTIYSIAKQRPTTIEDLDKVYGIGQVKKNQFGDSIIALLNSI